jgi:hypothetical protein
MAGGIIPSEDAFRRFSAATKHFEGTHRNRGLKGEKRLRLAGGCKSRNEVWKLKITGTPTGGSFTIDVTVAGSQEELEFDFDFTAAEVKTELATHTELTTDDIETSGGPFPDAEIAVEFIGDYAKKRMFDGAANIPVIDDSGLTGGTSPAAWIDFPQPGHPGNANP